LTKNYQTSASTKSSLEWFLAHFLVIKGMGAKPPAAGG